jgi:hypothetical protein
MQQPVKKLIGTVLLLVLVVVYALVATAVAVARLGEAPAWAHMLYFLVTGVLWVLPAMAIISWMLKAPRKPQA